MDIKYYLQWASTTILPIFVVGCGDNLSEVNKPLGIHITTQTTLTTSEDTPITLTPENFSIIAPDGTDPNAYTLTIRPPSVEDKYTVVGATVIPLEDYNGILYPLVFVSNGGIDSGDYKTKLTVTAVNDRPVISNPGRLQVDENSRTGIQILATDSELDQLSYSIVDGADASQFSLDSTSGMLDFNLPPDYEKPTDLDRDNVYQVTVAVSDGILQTLATLNISIKNLVTLGVTVAVKSLYFQWNSILDETSDNIPADYYKLFSKVGNTTDFKEVSGGGFITDVSFFHDISVHRFDKLNTYYRVQGYRSQDNQLIGVSEDFAVTDPLFRAKAVGYTKAFDTLAYNSFGFSVALSGDGLTMAVGAPLRNSSTGAVYLYSRQFVNNSTEVSQWSYVVTLFAPDGAVGDWFGNSISLSGQGEVLVVGAIHHSGRGSAYVYGREINTNGDPVGSWVYRVTLNAPNAGSGDQFGYSVSLNCRGILLAVGARFEDNGTNGTMDTASDCTGSVISDGPDCAQNSGATYVFKRPGKDKGGWSGTISTPAYVKAPNAGRGDHFGFSVSLNKVGDVLAVGAPSENASGAVYVYYQPEVDLAGWIGVINTAAANLKAPNAGLGDRFGHRISLSHDAGVLAVAAPWEDNGANLLMGTINDCTDVGGVGCAIDSGAVYLFTSPDLGGAGWNNWSVDVNKPIYIKALNAGMSDFFGSGLSLSRDGKVLAVGAVGEDNDASGTMNPVTDCIGLDGRIDCADLSGAVYVYSRPSEGIGGWSDWKSNIDSPSYLKSPNAEARDTFGSSLSLNGNGEVLAIGAELEDSNVRVEAFVPSVHDTIIGGAQTSINNDAPGSGAVYLF